MRDSGRAKLGRLLSAARDSCKLSECSMATDDGRSERGWPPLGALASRGGTWLVLFHARTCSVELDRELPPALPPPGASSLPPLPLRLCPRWKPPWLSTFSRGAAAGTMGPQNTVVGGRICPWHRHDPLLTPAARALLPPPPPPPPPSPPSAPLLVLLWGLLRR